MQSFVLHIFCNLIVRQFKTICVNLHLQNRNGSVAQLNRASDSGSEGRGFESHRNHQGGAAFRGCTFFIFRAERPGREKALKVVGLNPTGITRGCSCLNCTFLYQEGMASCHTHAALVSAVSAALFYFRAERLGREKVLKVVGLNPTGITMGCSCLNCTSFIRRVWHPCHTHAALVSAVSADLFILEQKDLVEKKF